MPILEKTALKNCRGTVLDVGAGAGCHSLWLQEQGFSVTAIDNSPGCAEVMKRRGVKSVVQEDINQYEGEFDTVLLLMNGIGLAQELRRLPAFLSHLSGLLKEGGQIIADSSDIFHLYGELNADEFLNLEKDYLGEVEFQFLYNGERSRWFPWIYLDEATLRENAIACGLTFDLLFKGTDKTFLVSMSKNGG